MLNYSYTLLKYIFHFNHNRYEKNVQSHLLFWKNVQKLNFKINLIQTYDPGDLFSTFRFDSSARARRISKLLPFDPEEITYKINRVNKISIFCYN